MAPRLLNMLFTSAFRSPACKLNGVMARMNAISVAVMRLSSEVFMIRSYWRTTCRAMPGSMA